MSSIRQRQIVEILPYAALLSVMNRDLLNLVTEHAADDLVFPSESYEAAVRSLAQFILRQLGEYLWCSPPPLLELLI